MNRRPICACRWGQGLVNASAIIILARAGADDPDWYTRLWLLGSLFADTPTA